MPDHRVAFKTFSSATKSWETLYTEAASFASTIPRESLITITVTSEGGADFGGLGATGSVTVWWSQSVTAGQAVRHT